MKSTKRMGSTSDFPPSLSMKLTESDFFRVDVSEPESHSFGGDIFRCPYPDGQGPRQPYVSRETYERLLRGLTRKSSLRIRWLPGTVVDLELARDDPSRISSVIIRAPDNSERRIPASFVIGWY